MGRVAACVAGAPACYGVPMTEAKNAERAAAADGMVAAVFGSPPAKLGGGPRLGGAIFSVRAGLSRP